MRFAPILIVALWLAVPDVTGAEPGTSHSPAPAAVDEQAPLPVPTPTPPAIQYHRSGNWLFCVVQISEFAVQALLLFTGFSARLRTAARRVGRGWFLTIGAYWLCYSALVFLIALPLTFYLGYVRQHAYGLSQQSLGRWFGNALKGLGVDMIVGFLFLWLPYLAIARFPRRWWLYTTLGALPFSFGAAFLAPIWIDPLFNRFGPMENQALEQKILAMADRAGIAGSRVFEVDKSRDTKALNAYVTGFFGTKRIVLYDTLLHKLDEREVLAVLGHEIGHYALGHVTRTILLSSLGVLLGLLFVDRAGRWLIRRYGSPFGFDDLADVASVPLLVLLLQVASLGLSPVIMFYSRNQEHEADRFALELTRTNHSAASAFAKLQDENLGVPWHTTFETLWRASHPSTGERIEFCNRYHPWRKGQPLVYGAYFRR